MSGSEANALQRFQSKGDQADVSGESAKRRTARRRGRPLVQAAADRLRDLILAREPGAQIGSLSEVAQALGVGIVTVQQAARVLEHEGLLEVRRGPGGGYYGARPDDAALERSVAAYLRVHGSAYREVLEMMSLLDTELLPAAARCEDEGARAELAALLGRIDVADTPEARISIEEELHNIVFRMVDRPLFELLARVTAQVSRAQTSPPLFPGEEVTAWKAGRRRIIQAILDRDVGLALFEAVRYRQGVLGRLSAARGEPANLAWARTPE
jgi:DNA-binding FadR family transcriptional regulator